MLVLLSNGSGSSPCIYHTEDNFYQQLNNCVHLVLVHNNGKVKMIASFNLDIFQTVVIWMIIFWDYQFQALEIIPFTAFDWTLCCIHPPWNVSNVNFLVFLLRKYNPIVSRV